MTYQAVDIVVFCVLVDVILLKAGDTEGIINNLLYQLIFNMI